jgi:hypothetical protein
MGLFIAIGSCSVFLALIFLVAKLDDYLYPLCFRCTHNLRTTRIRFLVKLGYCTKHGYFPVGAWKIPDISVDLRTTAI